jgi:thiol-disulfide isomerase/thioredoxin
VLLLPAIALTLLQGRDEDVESTLLLEPVHMLHTGPWRAWLESPGGELPFGLEIERDGEQITAVITNGEERIAVPAASVEGAELVLDIPHYDSTIRARISPLGTRLDGGWKKRSGADRWTGLAFAADAGAAPRFRSIGSARAEGIEGRFAVQFEKSQDPAVAILRPGKEGGVEGTFLTSTGDYRWLAGSLESGRLRLSCFDGAHAFLLDAKVGVDGRLSGDFWSGDRWHETWSAVRDANAAIPDEFAQAHWRQDIGLAMLLYPDLEGNERCLGESAFAGKAIVLQVLGSWCPNCHDETAYLARVYERYRERGLSVVGLAFEMTGDFERDAEQVRRMRERHGVKYPVLLAGLSDKEKAAQAFPALDRVFAFPTTIFLHRDGRVRAVHSGFAGPGTREEHDRLAKRFEGIIEELLAEPDGDDREVWGDLAVDDWRDGRDEHMVSFISDGSGQREFEWEDRSRPDLHPHLRDSGCGPVQIRGSTVLLGGVPWHFDLRARALLDPRDFGHRLERASRAGMPSIDGVDSPDPFLRREAAYFLPFANWFGRAGARIDPTALLSDPDVLVRCTAAAACARMRSKEAGPRLVEMTRSGFAGERREAALAIRAIKYEAGAEALRALRRDLDPLVRALAQ